MTQQLPYQGWQPQNPWQVDLGHLKTLAICHYVWGGLTIVFSSFFIVHIVMGVMIMRGSFPMAPPAGQPQQPPPEFFGGLFVCMGSGAVLLGWTSGVLTIVSGRCLARQTSRTFSLVMAGVNCLSVPFGTTLGVFTFIVLFRQSVQALYEHRKTAPA